MVKTNVAKIDRQTVRALWRACREGERALDSSLFSPWESLRLYYSTGRREEISGLSDRVECLAPLASDEVLTDSPHAPPFPGAIERFISCATSAMRHSWSFSAAQVGYIAESLRHLLDLLASPLAADRKVVITLRMRMCYCAEILERKCGSAVDRDSVKPFYLTLPAPKSAASAG